VPADDVALLVQNASISREPPGIGLEESASPDYVGYFENHHGEQLIFVCPTGVRSPAVWHSDLDWAPLSIFHADGKLWAINNDGRDIHLSEEEWAWIKLCLKAMGIQNWAELPEWPAGKTPSTRLARAILEGDKATQIDVLEALLRQLKENR